ncbi:MAG: glycosyltransferase [Candidatus Sumerlaeia bacterium]|nr:glycosyltransferase [Candidatus Sumerlaeia bacterium]
MAAPAPRIPPGLRVALVHDWLNGMRGGEKVLEQVCALFPDAHLHTLIYDDARVSPAIRAMDVRPLRWRGEALLRRRYREMLPLLPRLAGMLPTQGYDLVIATSHCVAKAAPAPRRGLFAAYIFSPMRYVWDQFPAYLGRGFASDLALSLLRRPLQRWDRGSNDHIDTLAADSAFIAAKIERYWDRVPRVIHPSVDLDRFAPDGKPPADYFLVVSALVPYKRVDRAIRAARIARQPLVVVGDGPDRERLEALAGPDTHFTGWVDDAELAEFYRRARALLYPGVEDFGITALESLASCRPVLGLARGGLLETAPAPQCGRHVPDPSARALAALIGSHDDSEYDPARLRAQAERFSHATFRGQFAAWIAEEARLL